MTTALTSSTQAAQTKAATQTKTASPLNTNKDPIAALSQNYETFLKLLTTQLQNQDPLQPQDSSEFTKQLVSFSQVEQQISTNKKLDTLAATFSQGQAVQALSYIGKTVEFSGDFLPLQGKKAEMGVTLDSNTKSAVAEIYDLKGNLVATKPLENTLSTQFVTWDGKDSSGKQLQDGAFQVKINAKAADGSDVAAKIRAAGQVAGVDMASGTTQLLIGNIPMKLENILAVRSS